MTVKTQALQDGSAKVGAGKGRQRRTEMCQGGQVVCIDSAVPRPCVIFIWIFACNSMEYYQRERINLFACLKLNSSDSKKLTLS